MDEKPEKKARKKKAPDVTQPGVYELPHKPVEDGAENESPAEVNEANSAVSTDHPSQRRMRSEPEEKEPETRPWRIRR